MMWVHTGRLLRRAAGPLLLMGCTAAPAPVPEPAPAPSATAPAPVAEPKPEPRGPTVTRTIETCVLEAGELKVVQADLLSSGDTVVGGRPFSRVYADTGQYAATRSWYRENEPIDYDPRNVCYAKYGLPRSLQADRLVRMGAWRGVPVFEDVGTGGLPEVVYVPVAPGCSFHPYQYFPTMPPVPCPQPHRFVTP